MASSISLLRISIVAPKSNFRDCMTGPKTASVVKLRPVPLFSTCSMASGSIPLLSAMVIASAVAARETANRMLLVSFTTCAAPGSPPAVTTVGPQARKIGWSLSRVAASPDIIVASVPAFAPATPPLIGASIRVTPHRAQASSTSFVKGPPTVQVLTRVLIAAPESKPPSRVTAWRKMSRLGRETTTVSQASPRSWADSARRAWRSSSGCMASSLTSWIQSSCPASSSLPAIGRPILPTPRNPIRMSLSPACVLICRPHHSRRRGGAQTVYCCRAMPHTSRNAGKETENRGVCA